MAFVTRKKKTAATWSTGTGDENVVLSEMERSRRISTVVPPTIVANSGNEAPKTRKRSVFRRNETLSSLNKTLHNFQATDSAKKILQTRLKRSSLAACIMGIVAVFLAIADIELVTRVDKWRNATALRTTNLSSKIVSDYNFLAKTASLASTGIESVITLLSILTCVTIYYTYSTQLRLSVVKHTYPETDSLPAAAFFPRYLLETFVCLFHVPPLTIQYGFYYKFQLLVILRLYLVMRYIKEHNRFTNSKSTSFLASVTKTEISPVFLIKMYFMKLPCRLIFTFYSLNVFLGGYIVYVLEQSHSYLDTVWMLVVTMTTLGFGDVVPVSIMARAFVGFASVLGIFLMALFISVVHEQLQLSQHEKRILAYIENAEHSSAVKTTAAHCIQSYWRFSRFVGENRKALDRGDWIQNQKYKLLQHKLFKVIRSWRHIRHRWSRDDYWRKFFVAEDTSMLLTDVSRSVETIANVLQRPLNLGRKSSKCSLRKASSTVTIANPPPSIYEEPESPYDARQLDSRSQQCEFLSTHAPRSTNHSPFNSGMVLQSLNPPKENLNYERHSFDSHMDDRTRLSLENVKLSPRETDLSVSVDHIDKGTIAVESIQQRLESLEKSLDQIFFKVKLEIRDVREAIKTIDYPRSPLFLGPSPSMSPRIVQNPVPNGRADVFGYPYPLRKCDV